MTTVTLLSGQQVDSSSEEWRNECEARAMLRIELSSRRAMLEDIERRRGKPAADKLKATMTDLWKAGRVKA